MDLTLTKEDTLSATLMITGCCIGAGMIGFPVITAKAGFLPSTIAMILCYLFATGTGLLILEATLWFKERVNLISMAGFALGKAGKTLTVSLFLFLFYCLLVAYMDGGGQLFANLLSIVFGQSLSREIGIVCCAIFVGIIVYGGTKAACYMSRLFLCGLSFSFCALLSLGIPHVNNDNFLYANWNQFYSTLPILLVCFGYQNLIPTLTYYVNRNVQSLRIAILIGNLIPLLIYLLWNFVILGILPNGNSLTFSQIVSQNDMIAELLEKTSRSSSVLFFAKAFSLFAIFTPFIANTLTFIDFLKDGFKLSTISKYDFLIYALVLVPPGLLTIFFPHLFLKALSLVGGFVDVLLFGILPVLIIGIGRYIKKAESSFRAPGGKLFLAFIFLFSLCLIFIRS